MHVARCHAGRVRIHIYAHLPDGYTVPEGWHVDLINNPNKQPCRREQLFVESSRTEHFNDYEAVIRVSMDDDDLYLPGHTTQLASIAATLLRESPTSPSAAGLYRCYFAEVRQKRCQRHPCEFQSSHPGKQILRDSQGGIFAACRVRPLASSGIYRYQNPPRLLKNCGNKTVAGENNDPALCIYGAKSTCRDSQKTTSSTPATRSKSSWTKRIWCLLLLQSREFHSKWLLLDFRSFSAHFAPQVPTIARQHYSRRNELFLHVRTQGRNCVLLDA